jgi:hypothetical protein
MDPITLILAALVAGLAAGTQDVAGSAIRDGYNGLKTLIQNKFAGKPKALDTLADYETDPDTYEKPLRKTLTEVGIDEVKDSDIITMANNLLKQVQQANVAHNQIINQAPVENQLGVNYGSVNMYGRSTKNGQ